MVKFIKSCNFRNFIFIFILSLSTSVLSLPTEKNKKIYTLGEVYKLALKNDQQIKIAYNNLKSFKYNKYVNLSSLLPQIYLDSEYQDGNQSFKTSFFAFKGGFNSRFYNFSLNQVIFNYGLIQSYQKSKYDYYDKKMSFSNSQQNLIIDTATKYFNIIKAQNNLVAQEEEFKSIESQYKQTYEQYKVGIVAKVDLDDVKAKLATSLTRVIISKTLLKNAIDELEVLTDKKIQYVKKYDHSKEIYQYNLDEKSWMNKAKSSNFAIKQSFYNTLSINTNVKIATSNFLPTISFSGSFLGQKYNPSSLEYTHTKSFMINISYPLFNSGNDYYSRKQAVYLYNQAKHNYEQTYREQITQVDINIRNIKTDLATITSLRQELKSQKTAVSAARAGYEAGTRTMSEVLNQLSSYYAAQTEYYNSFYDYFLDTLKLKQVAGELDISDITTIDLLLNK